MIRGRAGKNAAITNLANYTDLVFSAHHKRAENVSAKIKHNLTEGHFRNRLEQFFVNVPEEYNLEKAVKLPDTLFEQSFDSLAKNYNATKRSLKIGRFSSGLRKSKITNIEVEMIDDEIKEVLDMVKQDFTKTQMFEAITAHTKRLEANKYPQVEKVICTNQKPLREVKAVGQEVHKVSKWTSSDGSVGEGDPFSTDSEDKSKFSSKSVAIVETPIWENQLLELELMLERNKEMSSLKARSRSNIITLDPLNKDDLSRLMKTEVTYTQNDHTFSPHVYTHAITAINGMASVINIPRRIEYSRKSKPKLTSDRHLVPESKTNALIDNFVRKTQKPKIKRDFMSNDKAGSVDIDKCALDLAKKYLESDSKRNPEDCIDSVINQLILKRLDAKNERFWKRAQKMLYSDRAYSYLKEFLCEESRDLSGYENKKPQLWKGVKSKLTLPESEDEYKITELKDYPSIFKRKLKHLIYHRRGKTAVIAVYGRFGDRSQRDRIKELKCALGDFFIVHTNYETAKESLIDVETKMVLKTLSENLTNRIDNVSETIHELHEFESELSNEESFKQVYNAIVDRHADWLKKNPNISRNHVRVIMELIIELSIDSQSPLYDVKGEKSNDDKVHCDFFGLVNSYLGVNNDNYRVGRFSKYLDRAKEKCRLRTLDSHDSNQLEIERIAKNIDIVERKAISRRSKNRDLVCELKQNLCESGDEVAIISARDEIRELCQIKENVERLINPMKPIRLDNAGEKINAGDSVVVWNLEDQEKPFCWWACDCPIIHIRTGVVNRDLIAVATDEDKIVFLILNNSGLERLYEIDISSDYDEKRGNQISDIRFDPDDSTNLDCLTVACADGQILKYRAFENYHRWDLFEHPIQNEFNQLSQSLGLKKSYFTPNATADNQYLLFPYQIERRIQITKNGNVRFCSNDEKIITEFERTKTKVNQVQISDSDPRLFAIIDSRNHVSVFCVDLPSSIADFHIQNMTNFVWSKKIEYCLYVFTEDGIRIVHVDRLIKKDSFETAIINLSIGQRRFILGSLSEDENMVIFANFKNELCLYHLNQAIEVKTKKMNDLIEFHKKWTDKEAHDMFNDMFAISESDLPEKSSLSSFEKQYPSKNAKEVVQKIIEGKFVDVMSLKKQEYIEETPEMNVYRRVLHNLSKASIISNRPPSRIGDWVSYLRRRASERFEEVNESAGEGVYEIEGVSDEDCDRGFVEAVSDSKVVDAAGFMKLVVDNHKRALLEEESRLNRNLLSESFSNQRQIEKHDGSREKRVEFPMNKNAIGDRPSANLKSLLKKPDDMALDEFERQEMRFRKCMIRYEQKLTDFDLDGRKKASELNTQMKSFANRRVNMLKSLASEDTVDICVWRKTKNDRFNEDFDERAKILDMFKRKSKSEDFRRCIAEYEAMMDSFLKIRTAENDEKENQEDILAAIRNTYIEKPLMTYADLVEDDE